MVKPIRVSDNGQFVVFTDRTVYCKKTASWLFPKEHPLQEGSFKRIMAGETFGNMEWKPCNPLQMENK